MTVQKLKTTFPLPPRLTMDEYVDFMSRNIEDRVLERILIQKGMEERVLKAFRLHSGDLDAHE